MKIGRYWLKARQCLISGAWAEFTAAILAVFRGSLMVSTVIVSSTAMARPDTPSLTLAQAISQVQHATGGKILSASTLEHGRETEYRIKVLAPNGRVRVIPIAAGFPKSEYSTKSNKKSVDVSPGNSKEKY